MPWKLQHEGISIVLWQPGDWTEYLGGLKGANRPCSASRHFRT